MPDGTGTLRLADGAFDVHGWRRAVDRAAGRLPGAQAVCPFGFEVTGDRSYLMRDLRRYYVYLSMPDSGAAAAEAFADELLAVLKDGHEPFLSTVDALVLRHRTVALQAERMERAVYVFARSDPAPLLAQWARYVLTAGANLVTGELAEARRFGAHRFARAYTFQLILMLDSLVPWDGPGRDDWLRTLRRLSAPPRPAEDSQPLLRKHVPAGADEVRFYEQEALPRLREAVTAMSATAADPDAEPVRVQDFHGPDVLSAVFRKERLRELSTELMSRYRRYR